MLAALSAPAPAATVRPLTQAEDIFAIYVEDWGLGAAGRTRLVFAAWSDGHVFWSVNQEQGGPPHWAGGVDSARRRRDRGPRPLMRAPAAGWEAL